MLKWVHGERKKTFLKSGARLCPSTLWMDKILRRFSETSFCVPRAPILNIGCEKLPAGFAPLAEILHRSNSPSRQCYAGGAGFDASIVSSFKYACTGGARLHPSTEGQKCFCIFCDLLRTYSNWKLRTRAHPFLGRLDSGHTTQPFIPFTIDATVNAAKSCS